MKTQVEVIKNFDWFELGDVLEFNNKTLKYEIVKTINKIVGSKIKEVTYTFVVDTNFVESNLGEYLIEVEDADQLDEKDFQIQELKKEIEQLKQYKYWRKW
jgi:hypothetical protein